MKGITGELWALPFDNDCDTAIDWADAFLVDESHEFEDLKETWKRKLIAHPKWPEDSKEDQKTMMECVLDELRGFWIMDLSSFRMLKHIWQEMNEQTLWHAAQMRQMGIIWRALENNDSLIKITEEK